MRESVKEVMCFNCLFTAHWVLTVRFLWRRINLAEGGKDPLFDLLWAALGQAEDTRERGRAASFLLFPKTCRSRAAVAEEIGKRLFWCSKEQHRLGKLLDESWVESAPSNKNASSKQENYSWIFPFHSALSAPPALLFCKHYESYFWSATIWVFKFHTLLCLLGN